MSADLDRHSSPAPPDVSGVARLPRSDRASGRVSRTRSTAKKARPVVALAALTFAVVIAPQLLGGAFGWGMALSAGLGALAAGLAWWGLRDRLHARKTPWAAGLLVLPLLWTALQVTPLPCGAVAFFSPESALEARRSAALLGDAEAVSCTLSMDPGRTREELVKGAALIAAFFAALALGSTGQRSWVLRAAVLSVVVMAVIALMHAGAGASSVFGVYAPRHADPRVLSPLLNENHLAGFLAMGVPLLIAIGTRTRSRRLRAAALISTTVCAALVVAAGSRGGVGALAFGVVLALVLVVFARNQRVRRLRQSALALGVAALVAVGVGFGVYSASGAVFSELVKGDYEKLSIWPAAASLAFSAPWTGIGRGAFSAAFARREGSIVRFDYPENLLLQWTTEWGLPLALLLLVGLGAVLVSSLRRSRSKTRVGAVIALLTIALHDLVDFSLEMVGVGMVAAVLLGAVLSSSEDSEQRPDRLLRLPSLATSTLVAGAMALGFAVLVGPGLDDKSVTGLQQRLTELHLARDTAAFRATLHEAVRAHPAEPSFAVLAANEANRRGDPRALQWASRAMHLAPGWASPHVVAAAWLMRHGHQDQGLLELREAGERDPGSMRAPLCELIKRKPELPLILRAAPAGKNRGAVLENAARCVGPTTPAARELDELLQREAPTSPYPRLREARRKLRAGDVDGAIGLLSAAAARMPQDEGVQTALADAYLAGNRPNDAIAVTRRAETRVGDPASILRIRARAQAALGDEAAMRETVEELRALAAGSSAALGRAMILLGELEAQRNNLARALRAYEEAHRFSPDSEGLAKVAALAQRLGDSRRALRAHQELCERQGPASRHCRLADELTRGAERSPLLPQPSTP